MTASEVVTKKGLSRRPQLRVCPNAAEPQSTPHAPREETSSRGEVVKKCQNGRQVSLQNKDLRSPKTDFFTTSEREEYTSPHLAGKFRGKTHAFSGTMPGKSGPCGAVVTRDALHATRTDNKLSMRDL